MPAGYPRYYSVDDRLVKLVELPDGSIEAQALDVATGSFVADRSYFARIAAGMGKDVDQLTEAQFLQRVAALRQSVSEERRAAAIAWEPTGDGEIPYRAWFQGRELALRVNDFPAEPLYTLLSDGEEIEDLEDWPAPWVRPAAG